MRPAAVAAAATLLAVAYVSIAVAGGHGGGFTGLFHTGHHAEIPDAVAGHTSRVADAGYDGQFYHLVAHDPLLRRGYEAYVDNPRLRWRRIGLPGTAALFGPVRDAAYLAIELAFTALGSYWLARYAATVGASPAWGLLFLAIPSVAVSLDRMTVDLPLAALTTGALLFARSRAVFPILTAAALVRETGVVVIAAWCLWSLADRRWKPAVAGTFCAAPALAWWMYVASRTPADGTHWLSAYPLSGLIQRTIGGSGVPSGGLWLRAASLGEELANAGIWLAILLALWFLIRKRLQFPELIAIAFTLFASALGREDIWSTAYATGRTLSPLLIAAGAVALRDRKPVFALPLLMVFPRIALQYQAELARAARNLL